MRQGVHGARVVYRENEAVLARLKALAEQRGLTFSEVQRQANRKMLETA
jgi:hypothetical protein